MEDQETQIAPLLLQLPPPPVQEMSRHEKIEQCRRILNEIDECFMFVANEVYFERLEQQIKDFGIRLQRFENTYKKYPHMSSLKNLLMSLIATKKTSAEIFFFLKQTMSESNYEIMQYCCLNDAKSGLINSLEALICSFISLITRVSGREIAAEMYAKFSLPKPMAGCQTCPRIKKKINQEMYRLNMMLSCNTIKNFLSITPEDEAKVRQELFEQREQEENEDFSEVSDFSCISHLSGDSAFLNDNKDKYSELQALAQKTVTAVKNREQRNNNNNIQGDKTADSDSNNKDKPEASTTTNKRSKSSTAILNSTLDYQTSHAEISLPKWEIVDREKMQAIVAEATLNEAGDATNMNKNADGPIVQMEPLNDEVFIKRHLACEAEEKSTPTPKKRKSNSNLSTTNNA